MSKQDIDDLSKTLLNKFKPRIAEFGLELSYILLWILDHVADKEAYYPTAALLAGRLVRRKTEDELNARRSRVLDETFVDTQLIDEHDAWIYQHSLKALTREHTVESILEMDRRARHRLVKKLRSIAEEGKQT